MPQDNELKMILLNGSEMASANFTDNVMKRANTFSAKRFYYEPLVTSKIKKAFVVTFIVVVVLVLLVSLITTSPGFSFFSELKIPVLSFQAYYKALIFILLFWAVYLLKSMAAKDKFRFLLKR